MNKVPPNEAAHIGAVLKAMLDGDKAKASQLAYEGHERDECAWCGEEIHDDDEMKINRRGEAFCTAAHRTASNKGSL